MLTGQTVTICTDCPDSHWYRNAKTGTNGSGIAIVGGCQGTLNGGFLANDASGTDWAMALLTRLPGGVVWPAF